jgi:hypothetical protein
MIKRTNNELQNTTLKTKDGATRTQLKTGGELMCSERVVLFIIVFSALLLVPAFYYSCGILPMYDGDKP